MKHGFDTIKDILDVVIIPIILLLLGRLIIRWDQKQREKEFLKLIIRELMELKPYPLGKQHNYVWCEHLKKRFIHESIFLNPSSNTDFILSIDPDIVYYLTQLWIHFDKADKASKLNVNSNELTTLQKKDLLFENGKEWIYFLGKICFLLTNKFIGNSFSVANPFSRKIINKQELDRENPDKKDFNLCEDVFEPWRKLLLQYDERFELEFQNTIKIDHYHCLQQTVLQ